MNQDLIAQMIAHEEAARLLVYRAAWLADQKQPNNLETSIGKYSAAEAANYRRRRGDENSRRVRLFHRISRRALLPRRQVLPDRRRLLEHAEDDHRAGCAGISKGESVVGHGSTKMGK